MAYLAEHQAPPPDELENSEDYQPSHEDEATIKMVEKLFDRNKKAKAKYDERWNDFYNMYRGRQWKESRPSYRHAEVINLIFREIQSGVPIQMDTQPKFEFLPQEPTDLQFAQLMNQVAEADWTKKNWLAELTEIVYDSNIFGTGIGEMDFDKDENNGLGDICFRSSDPFYEFPSPKARNCNAENYVHIVAEPLPLSDIKKKWENGRFVEADVTDLKKMDLFDKNKVKFSSPVNSAVLADKSQQMESSDEPEAVVITAYIHPSFEIEEKEEQAPGEDGEIAVKYLKAQKYPNGRKIVVASGVLLEDGPNPFDDKKVPKVRLQNYVNQRQFWGLSDVEQLESPQKIFNKLISFSLDVLTLMGNPVWKVGTNSGVDTDNLFNQPGLIIEANDISQVQREEGVQLQPYVLQLIDRMKLWFDDVSGSNDVSRGARPEGVTAASAIQSLQEAAQQRIRQKSRNLDATLQDLGQLYLSRALQFKTAPQVYRLTNDDGSMKFFKFHIESQIMPDGSEQKMAVHMPYEQDLDGNLKEGEITKTPVSGSLDLKVSTGSNLSFTKEANQNKALQLFDRGILDEDEVLKTFEWPNREAVLQRVMQKKQEMAQAQAQQAPQ